MKLDEVDGGGVFGGEQPHILDPLIDASMSLVGGSLYRFRQTGATRSLDILEQRLVALLLHTKEIGETVSIEVGDEALR